MGCPQAFLFGAQIHKTHLSRPKKLLSTLSTPTTGAKEKDMHENVPFLLIKNKSSREGIIMTVRNRQNHWNEASLIVGNLAAAIAAKKEREATPHTPRYTRTRLRQFVVEVYRNLGPSYFRRVYRMSYESFCHLHHKLSPGIKAAVRVLRKYQQRGLQSSISKPPPFPNGPIPTSIRLACMMTWFSLGTMPI